MNKIQQLKALFDDVYKGFDAMSQTGNINMIDIIKNLYMIHFNALQRELKYLSEKKTIRRVGLRSTEMSVESMDLFEVCNYYEKIYNLLNTTGLKGLSIAQRMEIFAKIEEIKKILPTLVDQKE